MNLALTLALPPSVNRIWRSGRTGSGRHQVYRAREYAAWMNSAAWTVKTAVMKAGAFTGDVRVTLGFWPRSGDLDNRIKGCLDALQKGGAISNDSKVVDLRARWLSEGDAPHARVQVEAA